MLPIAPILEALYREPVYYLDRSMHPDERHVVLAQEAGAIAEHAKTLYEAAMLIALARYESGHAAYVVRGYCSLGPPGQRCDNGKSRTPWQLRNWCKGAWELPENDPLVLRAGAACALRMLRYQAHRGREHSLTPLHAAFCGYGARPWGCALADSRVKATRQIFERLQKAAEFR